LTGKLPKEIFRKLTPSGFEEYVKLMVAIQTLMDMDMGIDTENIYLLTSGKSILLSYIQLVNQIDTDTILSRNPLASV